jgi:hypothetical protein
MAVISDIRPEDVLGALAIMGDPVEGPKLIDELGFKPSRDYRVIWEGKFYDSKPVVGIAAGLSPGGKYVAWKGFSGGAIRVAPLLTRLGFVVDDGRLYEISKLRVNSQNGKPTPYQYVVLLWAISRLGDPNQPRIVPFSSVRDELAELLAPFAIADTPPDPAMPWLALRGPLWDLEVPIGVTLNSESDIKRLDIAGGLSDRFSEPSNYEWPIDDIKSAAVDLVDRLIGDHPAFVPLLKKLNLPGVGRTYAVPDGTGRIPLRRGDSDDEAMSPEVADAVAAVDEAIEPRRKFGRRLTAEQNRAIEQRAVAVVRQHFEDDLGYETEDVGDTRSYDIHATKDGQVVKVEVKGTTTDGSEVTLTANEVDLHQKDYPNNAFAIVRRIVLDKSAKPPVATGGELLLEIPWQLEAERLKPIAFRYGTGH